MSDHDLDKYPKLFSFVIIEQNHGETIVFECLGSGEGPGFAYEGKGVVMNNYFLTNPKPDYPEERLIVVLYHEIGHMKYYRSVPPDQRNDEDSEFWAFENSLKASKTIATDQHDPGPLRMALKYIPIRQNSGKLRPYYQAAIDRITQSFLWIECQHVARAFCLSSSRQSPSINHIGIIIPQQHQVTEVMEMGKLLNADIQHGLH